MDFIPSTAKMQAGGSFCMREHPSCICSSGQMMTLWLGGGPLKPRASFSVEPQGRNKRSRVATSVDHKSVPTQGKRGQWWGGVVSGAVKPLAGVCGWVSALAHDPHASTQLFPSWQAFPALMCCLIIKEAGLFFYIYFLFFKTYRLKV